MPHPEIDQRNPFGYSVHWQAVSPGQIQQTPWLKIAVGIVGTSMVFFAGGYWLATRQTADQLEQAEALKSKAEQIKDSADQDLAIAKDKISQQQQRLQLVNDCVYSALNAPLPAPVPSPAK